MLFRVAMSNRNPNETRRDETRRDGGKRKKKKKEENTRGKFAIQSDKFGYGNVVAIIRPGPRQEGEKKIVGHCFEKTMQYARHSVNKYR
jgi:hypothetical protein